MGDTNPIRTLGDYSKPSHEGYRNTIEFPVGNNVALETTFDDRVRDYMATHIEIMERFENVIFKQQEEINDRMAEMFRLLKELITSGAPKKRVKRLEKELKARIPPTKIYNVDRGRSRSILWEQHTTDIEVPTKEAEKETEAKNRTKKPIKKAEREEKAEASNSQLVGLSLASHSYIYLLGIAKDVLVDVAGYVYPMDFVILDIKEDEKSPFILGTPFLITAKAVIKFDKGTITLRSGKSKISLHRIHESLCKVKKEIKNDIEPIAPTMTVNRLVLEWEENIKLHQEKEVKFDQWRSKNFRNKHHALVEVKNKMDC
nr:hypothetical protein [Tanacetum cinerariifolium]